MSRLSDILKQLELRIVLFFQIQFQMVILLKTLSYSNTSTNYKDILIPIILINMQYSILYQQNKTVFDEIKKQLLKQNEIQTNDENYNKR